MNPEHDETPQTNDNMNNFYRFPFFLPFFFTFAWDAAAMAAAAFSFSALADASLSFFSFASRSRRLLRFGINSPIFFINDGPDCVRFNGERGGVHRSTGREPGGGLHPSTNGVYDTQLRMHTQISKGTRETTKNAYYHPTLGYQGKPFPSILTSAAEEDSPHGSAPCAKCKETKARSTQRAKPPSKAKHYTTGTHSGRHRSKASRGNVIAVKGSNPTTK